MNRVNSLLDPKSLPFTLKLGQNLVSGVISPMFDVTQKIGRTWRRSIRLHGGYWMGTAEWDGTVDEMVQVFTDDFMGHLEESTGGFVTWEGFLAEMELELNGIRFVRSWGELANRVKVPYSTIGDNLLTNGSAESSAWSNYNSPTTNAQSTAWFTDGTYSNHIVGNSASDGAIIQSSIAISANRLYQARVSVNIVSGTWRFEIYQTTSGEIIGWDESDVTGEIELRAEVPEDSVFSGNVGLRLYHTGSSGEIYADAAVFQAGPARSQTGWYEDTVSQGVYGVIERIISKAGMDSEAAEALAQTELEIRKWARTLAPTEIDASRSDKEARLTLTFYGYVFTLRNLYSSVAGTDDSDNHVSALLGASELIAAGNIEANTVQFNIATTYPQNLWQVIREIAKAGDASGNVWEFGVYNDRTAIYQQMPQTLRGSIRGGKVYDSSLGPVQPWEAQPGLYRLTNMPIGDIGISGIYTDDPRVALLNEVEFNTDDWLSDGGGVVFRMVE